MASAAATHARYDALMDVVRARMTNRAFAPAVIPRAHVEMRVPHHPHVAVRGAQVLDAQQRVRHAPAPRAKRRPR